MYVQKYTHYVHMQCMNSYFALNEEQPKRENVIKSISVRSKKHFRYLHIPIMGGGDINYTLGNEPC